MQGRRSRPAAGGATSGFGRIFEVRRGALAPHLRACIRLKQADSLLQVPIRTQYGLGCMGTATPPCRGGHQTSLLASCAELPDHIDRGHTAATHTLLAASVQCTASCASVTTASTLRALCSIGCFAWPCQPIVGRAAGTEVRSRTRGARVFKGTGAVGRDVQAAVSMQRLAPHDFKSSAVPDLRCATRICCVAEIMQHQTHSRSPLTHEDILGRGRSEAGFISSSFPASSPSAETPGLPSRSARSYRELRRTHTNWPRGRERISFANGFPPSRQPCLVGSRYSSCYAALPPSSSFPPTL